MEFSLNFPQNIVFGENTLEKLGELTKVYGTKCFIVRGHKSVEFSGVLDEIEVSLKSNGIKCAGFYKVKGEPDCSMVDEVRKLVEIEGVDFIIGVGGGSALDVAKAAAGLLGQLLPTVDYLNKTPFQYNGLPFIAIPTTAGTGSEITLNSVLYNPTNGNKNSIADPKFQPVLSIVDPILTYGMPPKITASTGMDALTHAIESYTSKSANPLTMSLAEKAIELIGKSLMKAVNVGNDVEARRDMAMGSMIAALAFAQTGVGIAHSISHPLGAIFHISHGVANAILLSEAIDFNDRDCRERYKRVGELMKADKKLSDFIRDMIKEMPIPHNLSEAGYRKGKEQEIVEKTLQSRSLKKNPRVVEEKDVLEILEKCI
ncbi:MAG: iron-containing alcohol dehydrogenase [Halanaerobiales bacterium]|nr:iron-containing alcohol dehydrogenase [Halanaerobiales bacterium]